MVLYLVNRVKTYWLSYFLVCFISQVAFSQGEGNVWFFGDNNGLDFNYSPPQAFSGTNMFCDEGPSSISDSVGNVLFYTNGIVGMNALNDTMPNANDLGGNDDTAQSSLIIQSQNSEDIYHVFSLEKVGIISTPYYDGLSYSILDMSLEGGLGDIVETHYKVVDSLSERLTAIKHANGYDYWIIVNEYNENRFLSFLLDSNGLNPDPTISEVGNAPNLRGCMKANMQGDIIAVANSNSQSGTGGNLDLYSFDNESGILSDPIHIDSPSSPYSVEFAPCSDLIYLSLGTNGINQYDLSEYSQAAIQNSVVSIFNGSSQDDPIRFKGLQLGPDYKIYCSPSNQNFLGVINNPDEFGQACNFEPDIVQLDGNTVEGGLPNFPNDFYSFEEFQLEANCTAETSYFEFYHPAVESVNWDFGDGFSTTSSEGPFNVEHVYNLPGEYTVTMNFIKNNEEIQLSENILIEGAIVYNWTPEVFVCEESFAEIFVEVDSMTTVTWSTGEETDSIEVYESGVYTAELSVNGCSVELYSLVDILPDCSANLNMPNVFSPNSDGINDRIKPFDLENVIGGELFIFNRWGDEMFSTSDLDLGWDGTVNGNRISDGTYFYVLNFTDLLNRQKSQKGSFTLIR